MTTYKVFSRRTMRRAKGIFVPNPGARRTTIRRGLTVEEARQLCKQGPANMARDAGSDTRGLVWYEFEQE
jgi:hypothetical protein